MSLRVDGTSVFLTGAAGGIGRAFVAALLARGVARIYAADRVATSVADWRQEKRLVPVDLDITDHDAVARAAADAGDVRILINNAGVNLRAPFIAAPSLDQARREMETNYFGTLAMCRAFAPILVKNAAQGGSAIVNTLSILAKVTLPNLGSYCASKAALLRLSEGVRAELGPQGVQVVTLMPWAVDTPMSGPFQGEKTSPEEVATGALDALAHGVEESYTHPYTDEINARLRADPKGLEHELAATFRSAR
jgi:NAD(P)-dependent dehydrogenase (short-subunit alcohol dehydrogenase family)